MITTLGIALGCLTISFLLSGMESALLTVSRIRAEHRSHIGDARAVRLKRIIKDPFRILRSAVFVGNLVNLIALVLLTRAVTQIFGVWGFLLSFLLILPVFLFFSELLPKALGRRAPYRFLIAFLPFLTILYYIPGAIFALFDQAEGKPPSSRITRERVDFKNLTRTIEEEGALDSDERRLIHNLVDSESLTAGHLARPLSSVPSATEEEKAEVLADSREPIITLMAADGQPSGYLAPFNLLRKDATGPARNVAETFLDFDREESAQAILKQLRKENKAAGVVRGESGKIEGVILIDDLINRLLLDHREKQRLAQADLP
ncbi:MAG: CNNM domain-containing protein [Verrucomicrobiota bacterium]